MLTLVPLNDHNFMNIHCIDLKVVFLDSEHFAHFGLKHCSPAIKLALLTKELRGDITPPGDSSIQFVTTSMNLP